MFSLTDLLSVLWFFLPAYVANMSPVLVHGHFEALAVPIDGGRTFRGKRIFGDHKTWRGIVAGVIAGMFVYELQRLLYAHGIATSLAMLDYGVSPLLPGFLMGLGAGVGDALKSFFKRQLGIAPGASWLVFDQADFFVGAYVLVAPVYAAPLDIFLLCVPLVVAGAIAITIVGYELGLKEAWI